jgi:DNA-binding response OmpR family regulator
LLTDVELPGELDGLGLARWVRERYAHIKIVIMSGRVPPDAHDVADAVSVKPYDLGALVKRVSQLMRNGSGPPSVECA